MEVGWINVTDELFTLSKSKWLIIQNWASWKLYYIPTWILSKQCMLMRSMIPKLTPSGTSSRGIRSPKWSKKDKSGLTAP